MEQLREVLGLESVKDAAGNFIREAPLPVRANLRQRALDTAIREINEKTDLNIALESLGGTASVPSHFSPAHARYELEQERQYIKVPKMTRNACEPMEDRDKHRSTKMSPPARLNGNSTTTLP